MHKLRANWGHIWPLITNILLPAGLFCLGLIVFYACETLPVHSQYVLHYSFYLLNFSGFLILLYFNKSRPAFFILLISLSYIQLNYLKSRLGSDYTVSSFYLSMACFLPLNLLLFYFIPEHKLIKRTNVWLLLALLAQISLAEFLSSSQIKLNLNFSIGYFGNITILGLAIFAVALLSFFIKMSLSGSILDYSLFFVSFNILLAFIYSDSSTALTLFFGISSLIILISIIRDTRYHLYKDAVTGLAGRYSFITDNEKFPLKYSIGLIGIDNYNNLLKIFGSQANHRLVRMIADYIAETEGVENIYRYNEDHFVVIYHNQDKKESSEQIENVRRRIASAEFYLNKHYQNIKLTVSTCISEKKRSDANAIEVLYRSHKALVKANEFNHNISIQA